MLSTFRQVMSGRPCSIARAIFSPIGPSHVPSGFCHARPSCLPGVLTIRWLDSRGGMADVLAVLEPVQVVFLWLMLAATVGSGGQYVVKAMKLLR